MTTYNTPAIIRDTAFRVKRKYETCDPFEIGDSMDINIYLRNDFQKLKGMYSCYLDERSIHVNANDTHEQQVMYCGHELGHDILHMQLSGIFIYKDTDFFIRSRMEYEANLFDAHLLLDEEQILDLAASGYSLDQIASAMNTYRELLLIKLQGMNDLGFPVRAAYSPLMNFWTRY